MPHDDPDPTDPQELVGVMLPGGPEAMREMAHVFADEFARLGYPGRQILALFQNPFYAGAHAALRALGEPAVRAIVDEAVARWPVVRIIDALEGNEGNGSNESEGGRRREAPSRPTGSGGIGGAQRAQRASTARAPRIICPSRAHRRVLSLTLDSGPDAGFSNPSASPG